MRILLLILFFSLRLAAEPLLDLGDPVDLDRDFNVEGLETMDAETKKPVTVYQYDLPAALLGKDGAVSSDYLDDSTRKLVQIERNGEKFVRFFIADAPGVNFAGFDAKFRIYRRKETLVGRKLQSHGTFRVTKPGDPSFPLIDIKMAQADGYNPSDELKSAIPASDRVERAMKDQDRDTRLVAMMPERFAAGVETTGLKYGFSIRQHQAVGSPVDEEVQMIPVHGLLGNEPLIAKLAARRNLTRDDWMLKEYLPMLAKFHAQLNFRHGIYLQGHTQNTLVRINRRTGAVEGMVGRDVSDLMYAPLHRAFQKGKPIIFTSPGEEIYHSFQTAGLEQPGKHAEFYVRQAVNTAFGTRTNYDDEPERKAIGRRKFLESYLAEVEAVLGKKIPRTPELVYLIEKEPTIGTAIEWIHNLAAEAARPNMMEALFPADQAHLAKLFKENERRFSVSYLASDARRRLDHLPDSSQLYATDGKGIFLVERESNRPLAYAHSLTDSERLSLPPLPGKKCREPHETIAAGPQQITGAQ